jgi:hypothetical protein
MKGVAIRHNFERGPSTSCQKPLCQFQPNFVWMILRWSPFKIVSVSAVLYPRWPPLLKIEITSNGQNCCIWSHYGLKFELYKYNYELFNILYSGFSYELLTFADFDRLCKLRLNKQINNLKRWTKKHIIMLIQYKFEPIIIMASNTAVLAIWHNLYF